MPCGDRLPRTRDESHPSWPPARAGGEQRPNIVLIYLDDLGYSDPGCFGGEIETPNIDRLAAGGIRFANYTTHSICSAARAALLTGRDAHAVSCGWLSNVVGGFPGYRGEIPSDVPTLSERLRAANYATAMFGKWHNTPPSRALPTSSKSSWPLQRGFEHFYGILDGQCSYFHPARLIDGNELVEIDRYPADFYTTDAWTDRAIDYVLGQRSGGQPRPLFLYVAHNAVHAPLHALPADIARHRGRYDAGWTALREARFRRQLDSGLLPPGTVLSASDPRIPSWDDASREARAWYARHMEVYAAIVTGVDRSVARLVATFDALGELDDTLFIVASDNGASSMGGPHGTLLNDRQFSGLAPASLADLTAQVDLLGSARSGGLYPMGWGQLSNTPFPFYKTYTGGGGRRVPMLMAWGSRIAEPGRISHHLTHVTDVMPTLLELAGVPDQGNQRAYDGISFARSLRDAASPSVRDRQYYECWANRAYVKGDWLARSIQARGQAIRLDDWSLHDLANDFAEAADVAEDHPEILAELVQAFDGDAAARSVYPLDNRNLSERLADGPPDEVVQATPLVLLPGSPTVHRQVVMSLIRARDFSIEIRFRHRPDDRGVLVAVGDLVAGLVIYADSGELRLFYNGYGDHVTTRVALPTEGGDCLARFDYEMTARQAGRGSIVVSAPADPATERRAGPIDLSPALSFGLQEGIDVGRDRRGPVSWQLFEQHGSFPYSGVVARVTVSPGRPWPQDEPGKPAS
ncbi:MAG: arylsulfatase [Lautropia sp.]